MTSAACGNQGGPAAVSAAGDSDAVAAYLFLDDDRSVADDLVSPMTMCNGFVRCTDAGFVGGLMSASVSSVSTGGWALEVEFNRSTSGDDRAALVEELERRTASLALGPLVLLEGGDEWPSCRQPPDCLTVDESVLP